MEEDPKSVVLSSARRPNGNECSSKFNRKSKVDEDCSTKFNRKLKVGESRVKAISSALTIGNGGVRQFRHSGKPQHHQPHQQQQHQQFYFGQNLNSLVRMSPFLEKQQQHQSSLEKYKLNKTLNHSPRFAPSKGEFQPLVLNGRYQRPNKSVAAKEDESDLPKDEIAKNGSSFGSAISSYSSMFSSKLKNGGGSRFYDDDDDDEKANGDDNAFLERPLKPVETSRNFSTYKKYLAPKLASCLSPKAEKSQDEIIKEFEAELVYILSTLFNIK